jgi:uncharacterized membrane protein YGL010W
MRNIRAWLDDYGESHRNHANKLLHRVCVPVIVWCVVGFLWCIPVPRALPAATPLVNRASFTVLAALIYYAMLSVRLALGALPIFATMLWSVEWLAASGSLLLLGACAVLFVMAWTGQFIGHSIEGKRPSFFKDVQFLLIGPLWLLADLYRRLGVRY